MRPRKVIVLFDENERARRVHGYLLDIKGYRALHASTAAEALELIATHRCDLVMARFLPPLRIASEFAAAVDQVNRELPILFFCDWSKEYISIDGADAFLGNACAPAEILDRVRMLTSRKRGPKKKAVQSIEPLDGVEISACV